MIYAILLSLMFVGSNAIPCNKGQEDNAGACVDCQAGYFKDVDDDPAGSGVPCTQKRTDATCVATKRGSTLANTGDNNNFLTNDAVCPDTCDDGFATANGDTTGLGAADTCADHCAAGRGAADCSEVCVAANNFNPAGNAKVACQAKRVCATLKRDNGTEGDNTVNRQCAATCQTGYDTSDGNAPVADSDTSCALNCAAGYGGNGTTCSQCDGAVEYTATRVAIATGCTQKAETQQTCDDKKRASFTAGSSTTSDDASCADTCASGFATAAGDTSTLQAAATCADHCAAGMGGDDCTETCDAATNYNPVGNGRVACQAKRVCATLKRDDGTEGNNTVNRQCAATCQTGFATATGDDPVADSDTSCADNCAAGFGGADCQACVADTHFSAANAKTDCQAKTTCTGAAYNAEGTVVVASGNNTADDTCECKAGFGGNKCDACASGTYSAVQTEIGTDCSNHTADTALNCDAVPENNLVVIAGTTTADAVCGCDVGFGGNGTKCTECVAEQTYSDKKSLKDVACTAVLTCLKGIKTKGTSSTDNVCEMCEANFYTDDKGVSCKAVNPCGSDAVKPKANIPATETSDWVCDVCAAGQYGTGCNTKCTTGFLPAGDNEAVTECTAFKTCAETGVKTEGTAEADAVCNEEASSAAALALSALTFFAMLL